MDEALSTAAAPACSARAWAFADQPWLPGQGSASRRAAPGADLLCVDFTDDGRSFPYRRHGWSSHEPAGIWTDGVESDLVLPEPEEAPGYTLTLSVTPLLLGPLTRQRLAVRVDGVEVGSFSVTAPQTLSCEVPAEVLRRDGRMVVTFLQPDAIRPCEFAESQDRRLLGFQHTRLVLRRSTTPGGAAWSTTPPAAGEAAALLSRFESLGDTCEFGFLQRRHGVEGLGLFRFAGIRLHRLLDGLEDGFATLGAPDQLRIMSNGTDGNHDVYHRRYGYVYHTFRPGNELQDAEFQRREAGRLRFLWRILQGDLKAAAKIFVVRSGDSICERHLRLLMALLRRYGDVTVLWVVEASHAAQVGTVADLGDNLLKGHVAYLTSDKAYEFAEQSWLQVCAAADHLAGRRHGS